MIFDHFSEYRGLRANVPRAQVRARKFGARQWIDNQKLKLLCIHNVFISSKLAEIEEFEVPGSGGFFMEKKTDPERNAAIL